HDRLGAVRSSRGVLGPAAVEATQDGDDSGRGVEALDQDQLVVDLDESARDLGDVVQVDGERDIARQHVQRERGHGRLVEREAPQLPAYAGHELIEGGHQSAIGVGTLKSRPYAAPVALDISRALTTFLVVVPSGWMPCARAERYRD